MSGLTAPGMTGSAALAAATRVLKSAGVPDPATDARRLLAHALGVETGRLALYRPEVLPDAARARFDAAVRLRQDRMPVSQIIGEREFFGRSFQVTPDVLDPRPETETLIDIALGAPFGRVLDLGTGSGCILLTLLAERPGASGVGVDSADAALRVARGNAARLGLAARCDLGRSDWFDAVTGRHDLVVSNPPYVSEAEYATLSPELHRYEPRAALTPGGDGLDAYRAIAAGVMAHLAPGGRLLLEIGPTQAQAVTGLLRAAGLENVAVHTDLDERDRVVEARAPSRDG